MSWQEKIFASITRKQGTQPHRIKVLPKLNVINQQTKQENVLERYLKELIMNA